ncbi:MAG: hypothetical protein CSA49_02610 [Gammaproteobacteria bacterium]|nr:MAG: hypothetical protein CSA49_02610 [Gammaproteobacteria bacterium]
MINQLKNFFSDFLATENTPQQSLEKRLQLATAALLLEMVNADYEVLATEQQSIIQALKTAYSLSDDEIKEVMSLSKQEHTNSESLYPFTRLINDHYSEQQKREVIRLMWRVALADCHINKHEAHLMKKISDLLYIPRPVVGEIKKLEMDQLQQN